MPTQEKISAASEQLKDLLPPDPDMPENMSDEELTKATQSIGSEEIADATEQAIEDYIGDGKQGVNAPDEPPAEAAQEAVKPPTGPSQAELRTQEMKERIARLQAANQERKQVAELEQRRRELEYKQKEFEAYQSRARQEVEEAEKVKNLWKNSLKDPISAYKELGLTPEQVYQKITDTVLQRDTPEAKEEMLRERLKNEILEAFKPQLTKAEQLERELAEIKAREEHRQQRELMLTRQSIEKEFLNIAKSGHEDLADYYEDHELVRLGDLIANEFTQEQRKFTLQDVAKEIKDRLEYQLSRAEERRRQRLASLETRPQRPSEPEKREVASLGSKAPSVTIGNDVASSKTATVTRGRTKEERMRLAELQLEMLQRNPKNND